MIKLTFLGTGGVLGIPVWSCECKTCTSSNSKNNRLRPSLFIQIDDINILIDMGQDLRQQLMMHHIKRLDYAFLTHMHGDHKNGMEELSAADNVILEIPREVIPLMDSGSLEWLGKRNPSIQIKPFEKKQINSFEIDTIRLKHDKDFSIKDVPCFGYIFRSKDFSFAYLSDFNCVLEPDKLEDLNLIISDGCRWENIGIGHLGIKENVDLYKRYKPKRMLLTHIHHTTEHEEANAYLKEFGSIELAYDGLEIEGD